MRKRVISVTRDTCLKEAGRVIFGSRIGSLPVVDGKGKFVGLVVEKDILRELYPSQKDLVEDYFREGSFEEMEKKVEETFRLKVEEVMTVNAEVIEEDVSVLKAASLMLMKRINVLPVVDSEGVLVGVLSSKDVFESIILNKVRFWSVEESLYDHFSKEYDLLIDWEKRFSIEMPFIKEVFKERKVKRVLDAGCGTGEHAITLSESGFNVLGVDKSEGMISRAREKVVGRKKGKVSFKNIKISEFEKKLKSEFEGVVCLGNVIAHTDDLKRELESIYYVLKKGGVVIFQVENFEKLIEKGDIDKRFDIRDGGRDGVDRYGFLRFYEFREDGFLDFNILTLIKYPEGIWKSWGIDRVTFWPIKEKGFIKLLKEVGFSNIRMYGDFRKGKFKKLESSHLIVVGQK